MNIGEEEEAVECPEPLMPGQTIPDPEVPEEVPAAEPELVPVAPARNFHSNEVGEGGFR